jgi:hypothetical protein
MFDLLLLVGSVDTVAVTGVTGSLVHSSWPLTILIIVEPEKIQSRVFRNETGR